MWIDIDFVLDGKTFADCGGLSDFSVIKNKRTLLASSTGTYALPRSFIVKSDPLIVSGRVLGRSWPVTFSKTGLNRLFTTSILGVTESNDSVSGVENFTCLYSNTLVSFPVSRKMAETCSITLSVRVMVNELIIVSRRKGLRETASGIVKEIEPRTPLPINIWELTPDSIKSYASSSPVRC